MRIVSATEEGSTFVGDCFILSGHHSEVRKGWFPKGWFWRMFPGTTNRNEGTFGCSPVPETGTRVHADVPRHQKPERGYIRQNRPFAKPPFCFLSGHFRFPLFMCCFRRIFWAFVRGCFLFAMRTLNSHNQSHVHFSLSSIHSECTNHANHIHRIFTPIMRIVANEVSNLCGILCNFPTIFVLELKHIWAIPPILLGRSGRNSRKIPERPRKGSESFSWNSPREYGWDPPNPIIQGI